MSSSAREKIAAAPPSQVYPLEGKKAAKFSAATMLVPSPVQIRDAIAAIPMGESRTIEELRHEMAEASGADVACPRATTIGWFLVAQAADEELAEGAEAVTPWWRVTRDRKPDPKLPGGRERHRQLLSAEGVRV